MSNQNTIPSSIKDNRDRGSVGQFLNENVEANSELSIVSAYFTIFAYSKLKNKLDDIKSLNFLFGEPTFIKGVDPKKDNKKALKIEDDKIVIPFENRINQKAVARDCSKWIKEKVNIKSMVKTNFLHGKMYHIHKEGGVEKAIVGSSNFTVKGLGFSKNSNIELNTVIGYDDGRTDLKIWFNELWDNTGLVKDVKDSVLKYIEQLYAENDPQFIYYKTLYHLFEKDILEQKLTNSIIEETGFYETKIWNMLYSFQQDAVKGAIGKIKEHKGCIIADSVGLGKTFEALAVIKYFELENKDKVLVLCPKKLSDNWTVYTNYGNSTLNPLEADGLNYTVLSHTDLSREKGKSGGGADLANFDWGNFDLVVIDESHNFRNNTKGKKDEGGNIIKKSRYAKLLDDIINSGRNTKVLLLSATPVNNNLKDLRNQLYLISGGKEDAFNDNIGISNLKTTMQQAQRVFTQWADLPKADRIVNDLMERLDITFIDLLGELTIARSRKHIETYYKEELVRIGAFPKRLKVISKHPTIDIKDRFPSYENINKAISEYKLSLYKPASYLKEEYKVEYDDDKTIKAFSQEARENYLIGMMKTNFLKRLESSIFSFNVTMERTIEKIEGLEKRINAYIDDNHKQTEIKYETPDLANEEIEDDDLDEANSVGKKLLYKFKHLKLEEWLKDLKNDKDSLVSLNAIAEQITPERDKKLFELKEIIRNKVENPINDENKKILVFTAFSDTATYIYDNLVEMVKKELGLNIALVTGSAQNKTTFGNSNYTEILTNFSPLAKNRKDMKGLSEEKEEIDILIATDCISEGQNLQDCDYLVNYDIHWNPVRIIQRFGRIDRLGSINKEIQLLNFWPTEDLNDYLNLKDRVESRMVLVDITATGEENLLNVEEDKGLIKDELKYRNKQLLEMKDKVLDLEELDEKIPLTAFSFDDFRIDLSNYIDKNIKELASAPLGLYAVVPSPENSNFDKNTEISQTTREIIKPGIIFCLRNNQESEESGKINKLYPYFLVYIRDDGEVKYNYVHSKQILDIFRLLASEKDTPYEELCDLFNEETENATDFDKEFKLLKRTITSINSLFKKKNLGSLANSRDGLLIADTMAKELNEEFELITWLIIK